MSAFEITISIYNCYCFDSIINYIMSGSCLATIIIKLKVNFPVNKNRREKSKTGSY